MTPIRSFGMKIAPLIMLALFLVACAATPDGTSTEITSTGELVEGTDLCSQSLDFDVFDLEPAGRVATLGEEFQLDTLGQQGALDLANELFSLEDSFCAFDIPQALAEALEDVDQLFKTGQDTLADQKLNELLADVQREAFSANSPLKSAAARMQEGRTQARRTVRHYLAIAARAQFWGNDERADDAIASANKTYETWASDAITDADLKEALTIAAEAQLLGLYELGDEALDRARHLAEEALDQAMAAFDPCTASLKEARSLLRTVATAMLLGVATDAHDFMDEIETWQDIQRRRQGGEAVPECESWQVNLELETIWESGSHTITWEGFFIVQEEGELDGQGSGSLVTHVETPCINLLSGEEYISTTDVTGSFSFKVQGKRETRGSTDVFKFQFPAEVIVSGVDTCNPFDETTYLPRYVIEEIHGSGGVEGYDIATDQIFLVVPAVDGATKDFETVIGPFTLTLKSPGAVE